MKETKVLICPSKLIHLSEMIHECEVFTPRVPLSAGGNEDTKTKRVCFSNTISGAYRAIRECSWGNVFYVHVPCDGVEDIVRQGKLFKPTKEQVYDVNETGEYWVKCKVKVWCIGIIKAWVDGHDKVRFRWVEKFGKYKDCVEIITIDDD